MPNFGANEIRTFLYLFDNVHISDDHGFLGSIPTYLHILFLAYHLLTFWSVSPESFGPHNEPKVSKKVHKCNEFLSVLYI